MRRTCSLLFCCLLLACGGSFPSDQTGSEPADDHPAEDGPAVDPLESPDTDPSTPRFELPDIWGPARLVDQNPDPDVVEVQLTAAAHAWQIEGLPLPMLAYNAQLPGPLLQAKVGDEVIVHFTNDTDQPTTIHWHGLRISDAMDGSPRIQQPVQPGETFTYRFTAPEAGSFWYHPHVRSHEQVERGLYGPVVIHDSAEPRYARERYLLLDDILVDFDRGELPPFLASHPEIMHGRYGNRLLTNGQASHKLVAQVEQGTVERWRIVNTANARTMVLSLSGARFRVIGTDGGPLARPYQPERLLLPVGQRYDLEVVYDRAGEVELSLWTQTLDDSNEIVEISVPTFTVQVAPSTRQPAPPKWQAAEIIGERAPEREVTFALNGAQANTPAGLQWTINGQAHPNEPLFAFARGETVKIRLVNQAGPEHPFHLHGQFFRVVDDGSAWTAQPGLKDTVLVPGMTTVEVIAYMDNPGRWMAHCHILEHAELGMMSEIVVE